MTTLMVSEEKQKTAFPLLARTVTARDLFIEPGGTDRIIDEIESHVKAVPVDISTVEGRKALASLAYNIAKSKTALDELGKDLVSGWKEQAKIVDADRKRIRDRLDALKDEVRKPLTDFENAEKQRVSDHESEIDKLKAMLNFDSDEPAIAMIEERIAIAETHDRDWQEFAKRAEEVKHITLNTLNAMLERRRKQEEERAELVRLRAEEEARKQREREEAMKREAAEKARLEAERKAAEEKRIADEKAQAELRAEQEKAARLERERQEAEERLRRAEELRIAQEKKAAEDALEAERKAAREREAAIEAEKQRVADEKAKAEAEIAKRERNKRHVKAVNSEAATAIMKKCDVDQETATEIVLHISAGEIPHVTIAY